MTGHRPFNELTKDWKETRRNSVELKKQDLREEMALSDLRKALDVSQEDLANALHVQQPAVAKMERRSDIRLSNLRRMIEAMGGNLEIKAHFPQGDVKISF